MNWIAQAFEKLKERFDSHVAHTNLSLTELATRIDGAEVFVKAAVASAEARLDTLEKITVQALDSRVKALEQLSEKLVAS